MFWRQAKGIALHKHWSLVHPWRRQVIYTSPGSTYCSAVADHPPRNDPTAAIVPNSPTHICTQQAERRRKKEDLFSGQRIKEYWLTSLENKPFSKDLDRCIISLNKLYWREMYKRKSIASLSEMKMGCVYQGGSAAAALLVLDRQLTSALLMADSQY